MKVEQRKNPNLSKKEIDFLITATDIIGNQHLKNRIIVRILSRISALGLCGGWREMPKKYREKVIK